MAVIYVNGLLHILQSLPCTGFDVEYLIVEGRLALSSVGVASQSVLDQLGLWPHVDTIFGVSVRLAAAWAIHISSSVGSTGATSILVIIGAP